MLKNKDQYKKAKFSLVATPIGNMEDITLRALKVLKNSDYIVCEDTRTTYNLLNYHNIKNNTDNDNFEDDEAVKMLDGIGEDVEEINIIKTNKKLLTFHANSSEKEINKILDLLKSGNNISYVSDAGTPTISDPGVLLVNKIREYNNTCNNIDNEISIESIPGPSAVTLAYSLSGAIGNSFVFYGFMPHKKGRESLIKEIIESEYTSIVYESVHRIQKLLEQFKSGEEKFLLENGVKVFDDNKKYTEDYKNLKREYVICRELTKLYEEVIIGDIDYCIDYFNNNQDKIRGEFVVVVK